MAAVATNALGYPPPDTRPTRESMLWTLLHSRSWDSGTHMNQEPENRMQICYAHWESLEASVPHWASFSNMERELFQ